MKYQIIKTNGKFSIRKGRGLFKKMVAHPLGESVQFNSESEALEFLMGKFSGSYQGVVIREVWTEDYYDCRD